MSATLADNNGVQMEDTVNKLGHCRCSQVQFEFSSEPLITMVCLCTACQRLTGTAQPEAIAHNYSAGFSHNMREVPEKIDVGNTISKLNEADLRFQVLPVRVTH